MAAFTDFYNPANTEYLSMDPHELDKSELQYELAMRNIQGSGSNRSAAQTIKDCLEQEKTSRQPPHYLSESPYAIERDLRECRQLCEWLERDSELPYIDCRTLQQKTQQCIHIMARLARMRYQNVEQMHELHRLQQNIIMLRYRYRLRLNPQIDAREIMETYGQQQTPIVTAIPTPTPIQPVSKVISKPVAAKRNIPAAKYELPKLVNTDEASAGQSPIVNPVSTTPVSATRTPIMTERMVTTPKMNCRSATDVGSKGAIPKVVGLGKLPFSQPKMDNWRSPTNKSPQSDEDWDISRMLSDFHITPERKSQKPAAVSGSNWNPIRAAALIPNVNATATNPPMNTTYTVQSAPAMQPNVREMPAAAVNMSGPFTAHPNRPYEPTAINQRVNPINLQMIDPQPIAPQPMPYSVMLPYYGPMPRVAVQPQFSRIPFAQMQPSVRASPMANVAQPNLMLQNYVPQQPMQNANANHNERERPQFRNGNNQNIQPLPSESSDSGSGDERNDDSRRGGRRPHSNSPSSRYDTPDECDRDANRRTNGAARPPHFKSVPINQWRISFSGSEHSANKHDVNVHQFLEQVELFRRAGRISENELLDQVIHLLSGNARDWYQHSHRRIRTWQQFTTELRQKFLPSDYNYDLVAQAHRRKQGKTESVSAYISAMELLFQAMSIPMAEQQKVAIVRANLASQYDDAIATKNPQTIAAIEAICKRIESTRRTRKENNTDASTAKPFRPRYGKVNAAEEINSDSHIASDSESDQSETNACAAVRKADGNQNKITKQPKRGEKSAGTAKDKQPTANNVEVCFNCRAHGHDQRDCKRKWNKHCYVCGWEGVVARECPKCNPDLPKNGKVNSLEAEQDSSQSETAHHD